MMMIKGLGHAVEETCTLWILVFSEGPRAKSPWVRWDDWTITSLVIEGRELSSPPKPLPNSPD